MQEGEGDRERERRERDRETGQVCQRCSNLTGPVFFFFFCKLLLNGASYDTKIGCIQFL